MHNVNEARAVCASFGGAIAVPEDAMENAWIVGKALPFIKQHAWLGLDDEAMEGTFLKPDGAPATFFAWAEGKPNGGPQQSCVALDNWLDGAWNDRACGDEIGLVCKIP